MIWLKYVSDILMIWSRYTYHFPIIPIWRKYTHDILQIYISVWHASDMTQIWAKYGSDMVQICLFDHIRSSQSDPVSSCTSKWQDSAAFSIFGPYSHHIHTIWVYQSIFNVYQCHIRCYIYYIKHIVICSALRRDRYGSYRIIFDHIYAISRAISVEYGRNEWIRIKYG